MGVIARSLAMNVSRLIKLPHMGTAGCEESDTSVENLLTWSQS